MAGATASSGSTAVVSAHGGHGGHGDQYMWGGGGGLGQYTVTSGAESSGVSAMQSSGI